MNKEIYEKILFVDKILNATINPRSYRYFRDIKKYILECDEKIEEKDKEIERLNNIINELEKYLEEQSINLNRMSCTGHVYFMYLEDENILKKLKELKGE